MIYLIDNQLPISLGSHLKNHGLQAMHVSECGLESSTDSEIWEYAKAHNCVVVSKDEDFFHLSVHDSEGPPVVWVRLGNCRNPAIFAAFDSVIDGLLESIGAGAKLVELR